MKQNTVSIQDLRKRSSKDIERLRRATSFNVGDWKRKRLEAALGKRLAKSTLLDDGKHQEHTELMLRRFQKEWGYLSKDEATQSLRFLTILDTLVQVDDEAMVNACESLERSIQHVLKSELGNIGLIGCVEMEIVNLGHNEKRTEKSFGHTHTLRGSQAESSLSELDENEQRKLNVLRAMQDRVAPSTLFEPTDKMKSWVLIHFHGLVHLTGTVDAIETLHERVVKKLRRRWDLSYAVELKKTFEKQQTRTKLAGIADYITKCGNERLRYETRFGRGTSLVDMTERAMWKKGYRGVDEDGEESAMEDSIGLTVGEVEALGKAIYRLMKRNRRGDGYVLQIGHLNTRSRKSPGLLMHYVRSNGGQNALKSGGNGSTKNSSPFGRGANMRFREFSKSVEIRLICNKMHSLY